MKSYPLGSIQIRVSNELDEIVEREENSYDVNFYAGGNSDLVVSLWVFNSNGKNWYKIKIMTSIPFSDFIQYVQAYIRAKEFIQEYELESANV